MNAKTDDDDLTEADCTPPNYGEDRDPHNGALDDEHEDVAETEEL